MKMKKAVPQDLLAVLFLVAMVLWFCHEMIGTSQLPFFRDLGPFFYPMRFSLAQSLRLGELPLWDRHMAMGFPLLANFQSGAFYPPNLFFLLFPFFNAVQAIFIFHYLVAATGGYRLLRQWRYPPYLALIGAILFTFGGMTVSLSNLLNHFQAAVWLPWVLLSWERWLCSGSQRALLAATLASLIQFVAGSPELYVMSIGLLVLDGLRLKEEIGDLTYRQLLIRFLMTHGLVLGLAMVQILPTIELFIESRGRNVISYSEGVRWSLHPVALLNLFFLDKQVDTSIGSGLNLLFLRDIPFFVTYYTGAISVFGICLWFFYSSGKEKLILLGLITTCLVLAAGSYARLFPLVFQYVPLFSLFRFPEKFFFFAYALVLFIALRGFFESFHSDDSRRRRVLLVLFSFCSLILFLYLFLRFDTVPLSRFIARATQTPLLSTPTLARTTAVLVHLERQIILTIGIFVLVFAWRKGKLRTNLFQFLLVGLVFVDLSSAHRPYQFFLDAGFMNESSKVIEKPEPYRLMYIPGPAHLHPDYYPSIKNSFGEGVATVFSNLLPNTGVLHGFDYVQELDALRRWPYDLFIQKAANLPPEKLYRLLAALNVKYITTFEPLPPRKGITLSQYFAHYGSYLYMLSAVFPRVHIVAAVSEGKSGWEILERLSSDAFDPLNSVILDRPLSFPPQENFQAQAKIVTYRSTKVAIRTSLNGPGILVLADSFYPGWRAYVDGREKEIMRANFFFRAVPLSAGEHLVEFRYQPRSFALGLALSLITIAGLVFWSVYLSIRRK